MKTFWKNLPYILLILLVTGYATYFSLFTIKRYEKLYAHYFDLGIMHQTVYNTYKGIQTGDLSRILELTNPHQKPNQIKRMAIHNDIGLALLAPFYFIYSGPETLLVIQSVVVAFGAIVLFFISREVLQKLRNTEWIALLFSFSYLMYYPLQKANKYEFHMVTLATTFLLAMYYSFLKKRFGWSIFFGILSILTKEEVGLVVAFFGAFILFEEYRGKYGFSIMHLKKYKTELINTYKKDPFHRFAISTIAAGIVWVLLSMIVIIPYFRGEEHFASEYFSYITNQPHLIFYALIQPERFRYLYELLSPLAFLSLLSPLHLLIALPELLINLLSSNDSMRNTYFHYTSVITPFVFISAVYGYKNIVNFLSGQKKVNLNVVTGIIIFIVIVSTLKSAYLYGPLPFAKNPDVYPWKPAREQTEDILYWKERLNNDAIKVAATGQMAPYFTSRRYFYDFNYTYSNAEYVVLDVRDAQFGFMRKYSYPAYLDLQIDSGYTKIYDRNEIEVFKKL